MKDVSWPIEFHYRMDATLPRCRKPQTFNLVDDTTINIRCIDESEAPVVLRAIDLNVRKIHGHGNGSVLERRAWRGELFAPADTGGQQYRYPTTINDGSTPRLHFTTAFAPWIGSRSEPLLPNLPEDRVQEAPQKIEKIWRNDRAATEARLQEMASSSLLFIGDRLYRKQPMPVISVAYYGGQHVDDHDAAHRTGYAFALNRLDEADDFSRQYVRHRGSAISQITANLEIEIGSPELFSKSNEAWLSAQAGIADYLRIAQVYMQEMSLAGLHSVENLLYIRERLDAGDDDAIHALLGECDRLQSSNFHIYPMAEPRWRDLSDPITRTKAAINLSQDFTPRPDADVALDDLRI